VLDDTQRQAFTAGAEHLERATSLGLTATAGAAAQRAWFYALLGRSGALRKHAEEAIRRGELVADMHLLLARNAEATDDLDQATRHYQQATTADPYLIEPYFGLGQVLARQGDPRGASQVFERGLSVTPNSSSLTYNAGVARAMAGDEAGAIGFFERALALDPGNLAARENLAGLLARAGRLAESAVRYRQALDQKDDDAETWGLYAQVLIALNRRAEAEDAIRAGWQIDPESDAVAAAAAQLDNRNESRARP
jgi:tetratricopeptide (TPR) repeat protein